MLLLAHLLLAAAAAQEQPSHLHISECEFGDVYSFGKTECQIELTNSGTKPIHIANAKPLTFRDTIQPEEIDVLPSSKAYLRVVVDAGNSVGRIRHLFEFKTDEPGNEQRYAAARGFALTALDEASPTLDFRVADVTGEPPTLRITLNSRETPHFQIEKILEAPDYLKVEVDGNRRTLSATLKKDAPWGLRSGFVKLAVNTPHQKEAWVSVKADVHGQIVPDFNPIDFDLIRFGNRNEQLMRLVNREKKPFKVGPIRLDRIVGKTDVLPCVPQSEYCRLLRLTISDDQPAGAIRGAMLIPLADFQQDIRVEVKGLILAKDAEVHDIADSKQAVSEAGKSTESSKVPDLASALRNAVKPNEISPPPGTGPLLKWTVANGELIHGYQVFRSDRADGEFLVVNEGGTIKSEADDHAAKSYAWRDNSAESGKTYWYYIGIVFNDGRKQQLTSPQKVVAK